MIKTHHGPKVQRTFKTGPLRSVLLLLMKIQTRGDGLNSHPPEIKTCAEH